MTSLIKRSSLFFAALALPLTGALAQPILTDISVFATDSSGSYNTGFASDTRPANSQNVWIRSSGGSFLNGPTDAAAQPSISLSLGSSSYGLFIDPGSDVNFYGINLFFGGSASPGISAFGPRLTSVGGSHLFSTDSASDTLGGGSDPHVAASGSLSLLLGDKLVTLTDYYLAQQNVFNQDLVGAETIGADSQLDYVGGITLTVTQVPEPQMALWAMGLLLMGAASYRKARGSRKN